MAVIITSECLHIRYGYLENLKESIYWSTVIEDQHQVNRLAMKRQRKYQSLFNWMLGAKEEKRHILNQAIDIIA
jgi:hypothetical protein